MLDLLWPVTSMDANLKKILAESRIQTGLLRDILTVLTPSPAVGFRFTVELEGHTLQGATKITMTNSQQATAKITPVDKQGNPAKVDGVPSWATSDATIVSVVATPDGMSAVIAAVGPLGKAKVSVTADADLGAGVKPIFGSLDIEITQGLAVGFKIELGEATEQGTGPVPVPVPTPGP